MLFELYHILSHYNLKDKCILLGLYLINQHKVLYNYEGIKNPIPHCLYFFLEIMKNNCAFLFNPNTAYGVWLFERCTSTKYNYNSLIKSDRIGVQNRSRSVSLHGECLWVGIYDGTTTFLSKRFSFVFHWLITFFHTSALSPTWPRENAMAFLLLFHYTGHLLWSDGSEVLAALPLVSCLFHWLLDGQLEMMGMSW